MLDIESRMLAHLERMMGNEVILIFQQTVNEDPDLFIEGQIQIAAVVYTIREVIVQFDSWLADISYLVTGYGKRKADMEGGSKKQVCKKLKPIHVCAFSLYSSFGVRFCTYSEVMLLSSFGFGYKIIWRKRGVLRIKGKRGVVTAAY
jgi:hypothetical protein